MLHFPELEKRPTRSAWAVNAGSAITSSLETRGDREAGMSAGSGARRGEGRGAAATGRGAETARKVNRGTRAPQKEPEGAAEGREVAEAVRPESTGSSWRGNPNFA